MFGGIALGEGGDGAAECDVVADGFDGDVGVAGAEAAFEGGLDVGGDGVGDAGGADFDVVADAADTFEVGDGVVGGGFLVGPVDIAFEGEPAVFDADFDAVGGDDGIPGEGLDGGAGEVLIGDLGGAREADFEFGDEGADAVDAGGGFFGGYFFGVAADVAGESDDAIFGGDADVGVVNAGFGGEFLLDRAPERQVGFEFGDGSHVRPPPGSRAIGVPGPWWPVTCSWRVVRRHVMAIGEVCVRQVVYASPDTRVVEAARLMREHHVGNLLVAEESLGRRVPVGIVTDRDIVLEVLAADLDPHRLTVGDIMSTELVTVPETEGIFQTIQLMRAKGVRRVPVVDANGGLVGIAAVDDLLELLAEELTELAKLMVRERRREVEMRR